MNDRRAHYIRPNHANLYPRRIVCIDTEARIKSEGKRDRHTYRLGAASFDRISRETLESYSSERYLSYSPQGLWEWIDRHSRNREQIALFAVNLSYDLRLSRALEILPQLGWSLEAYSVDGRHVWLRWKREKASLTMRDLTSFLPATLETIAGTIDAEKYPLPDQEEGTDEAWEYRCTRDVDITRAAVLSLLHWLESSDMGTFRLTGAGQAEACFRHRFLPSRLLVHEDEATLELERSAAYSGRCEVWRHGRIEELLTEWDYRHAYARIGRDCQLPSFYRGRLFSPSLQQVQDAVQTGQRILAKVQIQTSAPVAPLRDRRIYWPVGSFSATLWDNELTLALDNGAQVTVEEAYSYDSEPVLRDWAVWILSELEGEGTVPPMIRLMLKAWSRSLIGRFALRYPSWQLVATAPDSRIEWTPGRDEDGSHYVHLHVGTDVFEREGMTEAPSSIPAITSFVTAEARCRLWRTMQAAGLEQVVYVDTDSLIVRRTGSRRLREATEAGLFEGLRVKGTYREAEIVAPRGVLLDGKPRVSGVPKNPRRNHRAAGLAFDGETWEGLTAAIQAGRPGEVIVTQRPFRLKGDDWRRLHLADGATAPYQTGENAK